MRIDEYTKKLAAVERRTSRAVENAYRDAISKAAQIGVALPVKFKQGHPFAFKKWRPADERAEKIIAELAAKVEKAIKAGQQAAWMLANERADSIVVGAFAGNGIDQEDWQRYLVRNGAALEAYQKRVVDGMQLSGRVWRYANQFKPEIETALGAAIAEGKSANELAADLRKYLNEPEKHFRRVRDPKTGELKLSKAARKYSPGRGVYRSSFKNARRLAVTETNMAYRSADHERTQQLDFVIGIRINLSNNHTTKDSKGKRVPLEDICDEFAGEYPTWFKFTGWHPHCRCFVTYKRASREERLENLRRRKAGLPPLPYTGTVTDVPQAVKDWMQRANLGDPFFKPPYFLRENPRLLQYAELPSEPHPQPSEPETETPRELKRPGGAAATAKARRRRTADARAKAEKRAAMQARMRKTRPVAQAHRRRVADLRAKRSEAEMQGQQTAQKTLAEKARKLLQIADNYSDQYGDTLSTTEDAWAIAFSIQQGEHESNPAQFKKDVLAFAAQVAAAKRGAASPEIFSNADALRAAYNAGAENQGQPTRKTLTQKAEILYNIGREIGKKNIKFLISPEMARVFRDLTDGNYENGYYSGGQAAAEETVKQLARKIGEYKRALWMKAQGKTVKRRKKPAVVTTPESQWPRKHYTGELAGGEIKEHRPVRVRVQRSAKDIDTILWDNDLRGEQKHNEIVAEKGYCAESYMALRRRDLAQDETARRRALYGGGTRPVEKLKTPEPADVSIMKIAGGDLTKGSCASAGAAYVLRRAGFDVFDFRKGESERGANARAVGETLMAGYLSGRVEGDAVFGEARFNKRLAKSMIDKIPDDGEEYLMYAAQHIAAVKRGKDGRLYYLELQADGVTHKNGWNECTKQQMCDRFCSGSWATSLTKPAVICKISSLIKTGELNYLAKYINNDPAKQAKGEGGTIK